MIGTKPTTGKKKAKGARGRNAQETVKKKTKNFSKELVELWENNGRPETKRGIFEMLLRNFMCNRWSYISRSMVYRAAEYLYLRRHTEALVAEYLDWFDEHDARAPGDRLTD